MFGPATFGRLAKLVALMRSIRAATVLKEQADPTGTEVPHLLYHRKGSLSSPIEKGLFGLPKIFLKNFSKTS